MGSLEQAGADLGGGGVGGGGGHGVVLEGHGVGEGGRGSEEGGEDSENAERLHGGIVGWWDGYVWMRRLSKVIEKMWERERE